MGSSGCAAVGGLTMVGGQTMVGGLTMVAGVTGFTGSVPATAAGAAGSWSTIFVANLASDSVHRSTAPPAPHGVTTAAMADLNAAPTSPTVRCRPSATMALPELTTWVTSAAQPEKAASSTT